MCKRLALLSVCLLVLYGSINVSAAVFTMSSRKGVGSVTTQHKLATLQMPFIANTDQRSQAVKYYAQTFAGTLGVTQAGELVYALPTFASGHHTEIVVLKETLIDGTIAAVTGESEAITKLSYFKGQDASQWQRNLPSYAMVSLGEVYPGVQVKLKAYGNNVEKLFYIEPGGRPERIQMHVSGGQRIRVTAQGELVVETALGNVTFSKPIAYQDRGGHRELVEVAYVVEEQTYGFAVGNYDRTRELVIDPILAATFLGGSGLGANGGREGALDLVIDSTGHIYVTGFTNASDFPGVDAGSADRTFAGVQESFVAKLDADLSTILAMTFLGGNEIDGGLALTLDSTGDVYVLGFTISPDFPGIGPGSADSTFSGDNSFVVKLNTDLSTLLAATFLEVRGSALALDGAGHVYVAGDVPDGTTGAAVASIVKLNADLSAILATAFLGANRSDINARAMTLDNAGNVYLAGLAWSPDLPGIGPGSADSTFPATWGFDGFVAKWNADLSALLAATFLGGSQGGEPATLALDSAGNIYVAGFTRSADFPGVGPGSADSSFAEAEGFVAKLSTDLSTILAATFLGGSSQGGESATAIALALDRAGNVYVLGNAFSSDFPGIGPGSADRTFAGTAEGFVVKLNTDLSTILAATFLGGSGHDEPRALALDRTGNVYVVGNIDPSPPTFSLPDFPGIGPASADRTFDGDQEGFVTKLDANLSREAPEPLAQIASQFEHGCVIKADATLWCWGEAASGRLGNGTTAPPQLTPIQVPLTEVAQVDAGTHQTCAVTGDGTAWCWGDGSQYRLGTGTTTGQVTPRPVATLTDVAEMATNGAFSCARKHDGTAWCWGDGSSGQLGQGSRSTHRRPVQVSPATGLTFVTQLAVSDRHTCAVHAEGTAWCWGNNGSGRLGDGTRMPRTLPTQVVGLTNVQQVVAGAHHSCALTTDGTVWCWGEDGRGEVGNGPADTTPKRRPLRVPALVDVAWLSAQVWHTCAVKTDGTVWCWGRNSAGQLGDGTTTDRHAPVQVVGLTEVAQVSAGYYASCALRHDGTAWCWGAGGSGRLGHGSTTGSLTPVQVQTMP